MEAHQAPLSLEFSRQEHWSELPFPSPMHESENWKWSRWVVSDPQRPHGLQPTRLLRPWWDFPGKSTGVGCHCLLRQRELGHLITSNITTPIKTKIQGENIVELSSIISTLKLKLYLITLLLCNGNLNYCVNQYFWLQIEKLWGLFRALLLLLMKCHDHDFDRNNLQGIKAF